MFKKKAKITISFWSKNLKNNIILSVISIYHFPFCILLIFLVLFMIWIADKLKIFRLYEKDECMKIHSCIIFPIVSVFFIPMVFPMLRCSFMFLILGKLRIFFCDRHLAYEKQECIKTHSSIILSKLIHSVAWFESLMQSKMNLKSVGTRAFA